MDFNSSTPSLATADFYAALTGPRAPRALIVSLDLNGQLTHRPIFKRYPLTVPLFRLYNPLTSKEVGLEARNVGATTAPSNEQRFFYFPSCAGHGFSFFGGPCGALEIVRRSYVRSSNLHGLPPHLEVRGRFQICNVGANMANTLINPNEFPRPNWREIGTCAKNVSKATTGRA